MSRNAAGGEAVQVGRGMHVQGWSTCPRQDSSRAEGGRRGPQTPSVWEGPNDSLRKTPARSQGNTRVLPLFLE